VVFGLVIFQGLIGVYALTLVFVVDFFQVGSGRVNARKPDFRGGARRFGS
jgi:hypothetical protein